jgi:nucleoside-diphosphate-sugar epimerase
MKRCLITGAEGFIGINMARFLSANGLQLFGSVYEDTPFVKELEQYCELTSCDLNNKEHVDDLIKHIRPDIVFLSLP